MTNTEAQGKVYRAWLYLRGQRQFSYITFVDATRILRAASEAIVDDTVIRTEYGVARRVSE